MSFCIFLRWLFIHVDYIRLRKCRNSEQSTMSLSLNFKMEKYLKYVIRILNYVYLFNMNMRSNDFTKSELVKPVLIFKGYRYFLNIIVFKKNQWKLHFMNCMRPLRFLILIRNDESKIFEYLNFRHLWQTCFNCQLPIYQQ